MGTFAEVVGPERGEFMPFLLRILLPALISVEVSQGVDSVECGSVLRTQCLLITSTLTRLTSSSHLQNSLEFQRGSPDC